MASSPLDRARHAAERHAGRLPPLMVAAERVAATVAQGVHGRRRVGTGETFWQYRPYRPGDAAGGIDWRQSARSDHVYVRELEWEAAESVWLWLDRGRGMNFTGSGKTPSKKERGLVLLLALASLLTRAGERVALLDGGRRPATGRIGMSHLMAGLGDDPAREGPAGDAPADGLPPAPPLPRDARLVLIGDFLRPVEAQAERLRRIAGAGVRGHLLQVLDPHEETLPFAGRMLFEAFDGGGSALIGRVEAVRDAYRARLAAHKEALRALARSLGWSFALHHTDYPAETALLALYTALATKGAR